MGIEIIELDRGIGVTLRAEGTISDDEFISVLKKHLVTESGKFKKFKYSIPDYSSVTSVNITNNSIHRVSDFCKKAEENNPDLVVAIIVNRDLTYGLARMYQMLFNGKFWQSEIFRDLSEARLWIKTKVHERFGIESLNFE